LDNFYRNGDDPELPMRFGIVDWDDPASWNSGEAIAALRELAATGRAEIPIYDIPTNSRTGTMELLSDGAALIVAEGIFAAELVAPLRSSGILADAVCLHRNRLATLWFRLVRDLREGRKRPSTLIRRGFALMRDEPAAIQHWVDLGCRLATPKQAEAEIRALVDLDLNFR
jgi:uridine kinase